MAAEIIMVIEDEDAGGGPGGATIEPGRSEPADACADHDKVVALLDRRAVERKARAVVRLRVRGLERAGVLATQPGERRRIAHGLRRDLGRRRETGGDAECRDVEEVASRNRGHALGFCQQSSETRKPPRASYSSAPQALLVAAGWSLPAAARSASPARSGRSRRAGCAFRCALSPSHDRAASGTGRPPRLRLRPGGYRPAASASAN